MLIFLKQFRFGITIQNKLFLIFKLGGILMTDLALYFFSFCFFFIVILGVSVKNILKYTLMK